MLSELQTRKLTRYFRVYDIDDDGRIRAADFARIVENVRVLRGEDERSGSFRALEDAYMLRWTALSAGADGDADGGVDLEEWLAYWGEALADDARFESEVVSLTDRLFRVFDLDEDDRIGPDEFVDFYGVYGLSNELARRVFSALDFDGDGAITRSELLDITREFYRGSNEGAAGNMLFGPVGR